MSTGKIPDMSTGKIPVVVCTYLNAWFPGGRNVSEGLGGITVLVKCVTGNGLGGFKSKNKARLPTPQHSTHA